MKNSENKHDFRAIVCHPGTQYSGRLVNALWNSHVLYKYYTGLVIPSQAGRIPLIGKLIRSSRLGRRLASVPWKCISLNCLSELAAIVQMKRSPAETEQILHRRNILFQQRIKDSELKKAGVVIGYDTSSRYLAERCKILGVPFILDQSIGHPVEKERVFKTLRMQFPAWGSTAQSKRPVEIEYEKAEHELASTIVVPSHFVAESLRKNGVDEKKILVIPFGTDLNLFKPAPDPTPIDRLRFIFVGSVSARKGVPLLLRAWNELAGVDAELWIVGPGVVPREDEHLTKAPGIKFWGRRTPAEVVELLQKSHVFVFPSYFEGLAQVQLEAMAAGLPVIGTPNSGADAIVRHGVNGFIIPTGSKEALVDALLMLARERRLVSRMRESAIKMRDELSWEVYGERWNCLLCNVKSSHEG